MTFQLPNKERKWSQPNTSELFGTVLQTKNIDFDKPGYLRLAKRVRSVFDDTLDTDFGRPVAIVYYPYLGTNDQYVIVTNEKIFNMTASTLAVAEDATADVPTPETNGKSDLEVWQNNLYITCATDIAFKTSTVWAAGHFGTISNGGPMCVFKNKNSLAVGNNNTVQLYAADHSLTITLTLPAEFYVTSLDWSNNYVYVGTRNRSNGEALLFQWDGATTSANNGFPVGSHRVDSVKAYKTSVVIVTGDGMLRQFNGGGFSDLAQIPLYYTDYDWDVQGGLGSTAPLARVLHRGMVVENDNIFINLSSLINVSTDDDLAPAILNSFPSGVWCYDPSIGLHERYSLTDDLRLKTDAVTTANVNTTTDVITVAGATVPVSGTPVMYDDGSDGVGTGITISTGTLKFRQRYYVIYVSGTTMKLATTYADAIAGTAIDLTGTGNNAQYFIFLPNRDFGGVANTTNGAVCLYRRGIDPGAPATDARRIIFGGAAGKTTTSMIPVLNVAAEGQENRGYFITPLLNSSVIKDTFQNVTVKFNNIEDVEDVMVVKYRTLERSDDLKYINTALKQTGTWVDANTFTSTDVNLSMAKAGDEVEIVRGAGAGYLAHISSITENAGTYTVNIDEDIQNISASDTMLYFIDNWNKLGTITTTDVDVFTDLQGLLRSGIGGAKTFSVDANGRWLQLKVELRGEDVTVEEILINNVPLNQFVV